MNSVPDSSTVIRDVSRALRGLLLPFFPELSEQDIVFSSPAETKVGPQPKLMLYLYQIREDPYLRNIPGEIVPSSSGGLKEVPPPLGVDLLYMIAPYTKHPHGELIMIDQVKRAFYSKAVLKDDLLSANLIASGNTYLNIIPNDFTIEQIRNVWNGFPNQDYRISLFYYVSPVRIPAARPAPPVYLVTQPPRIETEPIQANLSVKFSNLTATSATVTSNLAQQGGFSEAPKHGSSVAAGAAAVWYLAGSDIVAYSFLSYEEAFLTLSWVIDQQGTPTYTVDAPDFLKVHLKQGQVAQNYFLEITVSR